MARTLGQNFPGCLFWLGIKVYPLRFSEVWASLKAYIGMFKGEGSKLLAKLVIVWLRFFLGVADLTG
jgi:hypothetical protein